MMYKYFNTGYEADLNTLPNQKIILSIISTLCTYANAKDSIQEKLKMIDIAITTIIYLNNFHHPKARELLEVFQTGMSNEAEELLMNGQHTVGLDFSYALKSAMDIMSSTEGHYHEAWKKALGDKLHETQALLEQKMEKLKRKQANATRKPGFWDHQPPSSSDESTSTSQSDCTL